MTNEMLMILTLLALALTFAGLLSNYKIFMLLAIAPLFAISIEMATSEFDGAMLVATALSGWILFNVYAALFGGRNE